MRIGLYGMPSAGKSFILEKIDFMEVIAGSRLLREYDPEFDTRDEFGRDADRKAVAEILKAKPDFIMDGHYAFGEEIAFTEADGELYDVFIYLYLDPIVLEQRMAVSEKNQKYLRYNVKAWQLLEINELRAFCHWNMKDFYVIDNPPSNSFDDVQDILDFIWDIKNGYSCRAFAKHCADDILCQCGNGEIYLFDGDKTLTIEDSSSAVLGYRTNIYDGNFYTGFQAWRQSKDFEGYVCPKLETIPVTLNDKITCRLTGSSFILTSGHCEIWRVISTQLNIPCYSGVQMSAETKLFITKYLQDAGKKVIAFGDSMNDYFMLKTANEGYLVTKQNGTLSRSLMNRDIGGLIIV